jgi:hypothetical protein
MPPVPALIPRSIRRRRPAPTIHLGRCCRGAATPPVPVYGGRLNFIQLRLIAPRNTRYRRWTPVVWVSRQVCVAQAAPVPVAAIAHDPTSGPVCVSACSSRVVAVCATTRS